MEGLRITPVRTVALFFKGEHDVVSIQTYLQTLTFSARKNMQTGCRQRRDEQGEWHVLELVLRWRRRCNIKTANGMSHTQLEQ